MRVKEFGVKDAVELLGIGYYDLIAWLRSGKCPFGAYIKDENKERGSFYINRERLTAYITAADMRPICPYADRHANVG